MQLPILQLPKRIPVLPSRQPQENVPQTRAERERLKQFVMTEQFLACNCCVFTLGFNFLFDPPLPSLCVALRVL